MAEQNLPLQIFQTIVGFVGLCGNGLVCAVIAKVRFMHTVTNAFIFNQALVDLLGSLLIIVSTLVPIPDPLPSGVNGVLLCLLWLTNYFVWGLFVTSTFNLLALTLERYLAIVFPFRYQVLGTRRNVIAVVLGVWVSGFSFVAYGLFLRYYEAGQCKQKLVANAQAFGVAIFVVTYLLPVSVMLVVYVHITVVLKRGAGQVVPGPATARTTMNNRRNTAAEGQGESLMRARRNTFKTLLIVCAAFIVCWTPNQVIFFLFNLGVDVDFTSAIYLITVGMVATNCSLNPFIYAIKYKQFREALKTLFGRRAFDDESSVATVSATLG